MAPPTAKDPWLAGRHFGIVIDAGSSGSRLQIYSWKDPRTLDLPKGSPIAMKLPKVEKGTRNENQWVSKVEPGLSSLADNPHGVGAYLRPLLSHAREHIPPSLHKETPLFLLATAGMRLLSPIQQAAVLKETCQFLNTHSNFKIDAPSSAGPCGSSIRIITGEEEGLFGWIAVNYLMDGFTSSSAERTTYGFLDMGGASTQIAFEPSLENQKKTNNLMDVRLRLLSGEEIQHKVFVTTWLGYGTNQARERYVGKAITEYDGHLPEGEDEEDDVHHRIPDPCLPKGLLLTESPVHATNPGKSHLMKSHHLLGTGDFEKCLKSTSSLLHTNAPCPDTPCLMNGIHVPPIDFSVSHFIGVSEYWYSSEHIFGLGGAYDFVQYERAASSFCSRDWQGILKEHEESSRQHRLGGDGEVVKDGKVVEAGQWGPNVEMPRLQMQCFKAAWISNVLHDGIKMPRIVDPGGNSTTDGDHVEHEAKKKGLGRPKFQSMDTVGDIAISWTLGKMVLEASKEVPPLKKNARPIQDPIDDIDDSNFPIQPIRPPFLSIGGIEERITPHLPSSLSRESLGFSPVFFLLYVFVIFVFLTVIYPMRRSIRGLCLRAVRSATNTKREPAYIDLMEEGFVNGRPPSTPTSSPGSIFLYPLRRLFTPTRAPQRASLNVSTSNHSILRHIIPLNGNGNGFSSPKASPTRANFNTSEHPSVGTSTQYVPRSPSPGPAMFDDNIAIGAGQSLMMSRSRNTSLANLNAMNGNGTAFRPNGAISRSSSMHGKLATN
ncbi:nucleoside phosphatase family-domain-containing protein [Crepidotus variabilis]|uniref:Nucleoside phosphatase family-domain-containing protein n=1 Tax=Crepidotus variabilis TaxID=179855 RepID=A0A9P6JUE3_9AGAR|nr:nucleoside phosphatase family-domain-containing protein [Crepidotus variabilis]